MQLHLLALIVASFLCALVAGFVFAFAVVVMPGIRQLDDRAFIRAFQVIDGVIQRGQPIFALVWLGSALALVAAALLGYSQWDGPGRWLLIGATAAYLLGVQLPTIVCNVPLNNRLQALNLDHMDAASQRSAREAFEARWNRWNLIRTLIASMVTLSLLYLLLRS